MIDLDEHITRVLHHHADDTAVENNLEVIVSNGNIVRFTRTKQTSTRRTPQFIVAAAAAAILVVGGGIAITQLGTPTNESLAASDQNEPQPGPSNASDPGVPIFPVLDQIPVRYGTVYGTEVTFIEPYISSVILGRIDGDRLTDVATITAAPVGVEGGTDVLIPPDAQLSTDTVGGREVDVFENGAGRSYRWDDDGIVVLVRATADSDQIVANITVSIDPESGLARIETGVLPDGIEVIAAPEPLRGNQPGLSTDDGPANLILNLYPTNSPLTIETSEIESRTIVEINGATGYATSFGDGAIVTWPSRAGTWLELSAARTTVDDLIEIARQVRLVDQPSWERRYDVTYKAQTSTPPTTMG